MTDKITLDVNGSIATITNRNVEKHNVGFNAVVDELNSCHVFNAVREPLGILVVFRKTVDVMSEGE